jgi:tRNA(Leu) C34 or U34 (ribose-2'-O)-methylase TrmL
VAVTKPDPDPAFDEPRRVGVGPHPQPWPDDSRLDPDLLANGDQRNVVDRYRYWRTEAVKADLDERRHPFHVAIEKLAARPQHRVDRPHRQRLLAEEVHIVGRRRWNKRGAMVTDRYQHVRYHPDVDALIAWAAEADLEVVAIDNTPSSQPIESVELPRRVLLLFGQEGPGLTDEASAGASATYSIAQYGSTRSINASVAAGIAMHAWIRSHAESLG